MRGCGTVGLFEVGEVQFPKQGVRGRILWVAQDRLLQIRHSGFELLSLSLTPKCLMQLSQFAPRFWVVRIVQSGLPIPAFCHRWTATAQLGIVTLIQMRLRFQHGHQRRPEAEEQEDDREEEWDE